MPQSNLPLSKPNKQRTVIVIKSLVAVVLLSVLVSVAGSQLAPNLPLSTILLNCVIGAVVLFLLLVVASVVALTFNQFILRHGGTDPAWFWFKSEPPGLEKLRAQLNAQDK